MKRYLYFIAGFFIVSLVLFFMISRNHWWFQTSHPKVFYKDEPAPESEVFESREGDYMVNIIQAKKPLGGYVISRSEKAVGIDSPNDSIKLPWCYFVWDYPIEFSRAGTEAIYPYAKINFDGDQVTFTLRDDEKVRIEF